MSWQRPSVTGPSPSARCAHTTSSVGSGKLFVFGGWNGTRMLNDLQVFHYEAMAWGRPVTTGIIPGPRAGHTMTAVGSKLFIFGGGDGNHYLNDLHILDTEVMTWSQAYVAGTSPAARSRHTMSLLGTKMYVFGGGDDSRVYNDLYVLDTETMSWSRPIVKGAPPVARWGHTTTLIGDGKFLVFGGHDGSGMLNDVHLLDTISMTWTLIQTKSIEGNTGPTARAGHTATLVSDKKVLVFGGGDGAKILNDCWFLEIPNMISSMTWSKPNISGIAPAGRCAHTSTLSDSNLIVFGGGDGGRRFKDLYILEIEQVLNGDTSKTKTKLKNDKKKKDKKEETKEPKIKDVTTFLTNLGLKKYVEKFIAQEIDVETLSFLTEHHLEQLGVATLGARLKILLAIKSLQGGDSKEKEMEELMETAQSLKDSVETLTLSTKNLGRILETMFINGQTKTLKLKEEIGHEKNGLSSLLGPSSEP